MNKTITEQTVKPITLTNIILYGLDGKPARTYKRVVLDGEVVKEADGEYLHTQDGWLAYCRKKADGKVIPPSPVLYAGIGRMHEEKNPALEGILKDLNESWLCTSTRPNYERGIITHGYGFKPWELKCRIPLGNHYFDELKDDKAWREALQALLMPKDIDQAIEILNDFSGVRSYVETPEEEDRKRIPKRAVWLYSLSGRLSLDATCWSNGRLGRARRAVLEK